MLRVTPLVPAPLTKEDGEKDEEAGAREATPALEDGGAGGAGTTNVNPKTGGIGTVKTLLGPITATVGAGGSLGLTVDESPDLLAEEREYRAWCVIVLGAWAGRLRDLIHSTVLCFIAGR